MHVLVVNTSLRPIGGAEIYVRSTVDALVDRGHALTVLTADTERPPLPDEGRWFGCPDFFETSLSRIARAIRGARVVDRLLRDRSPDIALLNLVDSLPGMRLLERSLPTIRFVHTAWPYCPAGTRWLPSSNRPCDREVGFRCLAVNRNEHCLVTLAGEPFGLKNSARRLLDMRLQLGFFRAATLVAANSRYTEFEVRRFVGSHVPIVVLPPPVHVPVGAPAGFIQGRVLIAGRMTAAKGFRDAIRAVAPISGAYLAIAGSGPCQPELRRLVDELGLRDRVSFLGWLDAEALDVEMQQSQVVLFPSTWPETFGQVGVQAALRMRPVVAYDAGGVREWLSERTGVLLRVGDVGGLSKAIRDLLDDPARCRALGQAAHEAALRFGPAPFAERMECAMGRAVEIWGGRGER